MSHADSKTFWNSQTSSLHRTGTADFYARKAEEHVTLLDESERIAPAVDLGCGAGELLAQLLKHTNVRVGVDFSESMLDEARQTLAHTEVELLSADVFEYLPGSHFSVWTTTGALNQYLDEVRLNDFLDIFVANSSARSLFLFDCVDPIRDAVIPYGIAYRRIDLTGNTPLHTLARRIYIPLRRSRLALRLAFGTLERPFQSLRREGMGYGQLPSFWLDAAARRNLNIEIVSSRYYEYRYHVALRKGAA